MNINPPIQLISQAQATMDRVSHRLAQGLYKARLPQDMTKMMIAEKAVKTAVAVIRANDEMLGSLLDIKA
jgi:hypothetical protein